MIGVKISPICIIIIIIIAKIIISTIGSTNKRTELLSCTGSTSDYTKVRTRCRCSTVEASHGIGCMPPRKIPISPDIEKLIQEACTLSFAPGPNPKHLDVIRGSYWCCSSLPHCSQPFSWSLRTGSLTLANSRDSPR